jgi:hypothetical protein
VKTFWEIANQSIKSGIGPAETALAAAEMLGVGDEVESRLASGEDAFAVLESLEPTFNKNTGQEPKTDAQIYQEAYNKQPSFAKGGVQIAQGVLPLIRGAQQLISGDDPELQQKIDAEAESARVLAENPGGMIGQGVGVAVPTMLAAAPLAAPIAGLSLPGRIAAGAGLGAGFGAEMAVPTGESRVGNALTGAAFGAGGQAIGEIIGAVVPTAARAVMARIPKGTPPAAVENAIMVNVIADLKTQGIDWAQLGPDVQKAFRDYAKSSVQGAQLPNELVREAAVNQLPIPFRTTKGMLTNDLEQQITEQQVYPHVGGELKSRIEDVGPVLRRNTEEAVKGGADDPLKAAENIKKMAGSKLKAVKAGVSAKYKEAESVAGANVAKPDEFVEWLWQNRNNEGVPSIISRLKDVGGLEVTDAGTFRARPVMLQDLYKVRTVASTAQKDGGSKGHYAGEAKKAIDEVFDLEGGDAYRKAAALRRAQSAQFDERDFVKKLVGTKGQQDAMSDEQVIPYLMNRPVKDLLALRRFTAGGNEKALEPLFKTPKLMEQGKAALGDIRAAVGHHLIRNAGGQEGFSAARFITEYEKAGGTKRDMKLANDRWVAMLGNKGAKDLRNIYNAAKVGKYQDEAVPKGSARHNTNIAAKLARWTSEKASLIPVAGLAVKPVVDTAIARGATSYSPAAIVGGKADKAAGTLAGFGASQAAQASMRK